ncbi:MAG: PhoH family protein [Sphingomonadales bacterium]
MSGAISHHKSDKPAPTQSVVRFSDNKLLAGLFGEHDRHLARLEQELDVTIKARGNNIAIDGGESSRSVAEAVLRNLYQRLECGEEIGFGEVDGAIRMFTANAGRPEATTAGKFEANAVQTGKRLIKPRSPTQADYVARIMEKELVFGLGPAGTGKTYLAVACAVKMLIEGRVDRLILSRPAVEAGERLGFLPGDMRDKIDPYLRPLYDALYDMLPGDKVIKSLASGEIEVAPLAFMRGRTLSNAFVILDEAQNTTPVQMKMFLTRLGENSRMVVTGDPSQVDLPGGAHSGLIDAVEAVSGVSGVGLIRFTEIDVVRHSLVTRVLRAYNVRDERVRAAAGADRRRGTQNDE